MTTPPAGPVILCCLRWARPGERAGLTAYEDQVLALVVAHGGSVLQRAVADGAEGRPDELQSFRFESQAAVDRYLADPRRVALAADRRRVVARTELFPIQLRAG